MLTLNKVKLLRTCGSSRWPGAKDRRRRRDSIAGDGLSGPEVRPHRPFEPSISGCLTGDLGVPGYEPDGISWLPHPATAHRATARRRSSVRIGACRINLSRDLSEEFPEAREVLETSLQFDLPRGVGLKRTDLAEDEAAQRVRIGRDRDVCRVDAAVEEACDLLVREREVIFRAVLQFDEDRLLETRELCAERRVGGDLRIELANQVLEHLPHHERPPNSSSLRIRDSASNRRAVSQEARVCGGRVPFFLIHFSRNAIVSGSDE